MNDDTSRLALARAAWRATQPSDAQVDAGARRVRRALRSASLRPRTGWSPGIVAVATVCGAALAYAAVATLGSPPREPIEDRAPTTPPAVSASGSKPRHAEAPSAPASAPRPPASSAPPAGAASTPPTARTSWHDVDAALRGGRRADATRALEDLARTGSTTERAKARLGLVQLAAGAGDCERARAQLAALEGYGDAKLVERGRRLVAACK